MSSSEEETAVPRRRLTCSKCFDALWFCYSPVHQLQQYYRVGVLDNFAGKWSVLVDCLSLKTKRIGEVEEILKAREESEHHIWSYRSPQRKQELIGTISSVTWRTKIKILTLGFVLKELEVSGPTIKQHSLMEKDGWRSWRPHTLGHELNIFIKHMLSPLQSLEWSQCRFLFAFFQYYEATPIRLGHIDLCVGSLSMDPMN